MTERVVFRFSIRTEMTIPFGRMKQHVQAALGCSFQEGEFLGGLPAHVADLLGMRVYLRRTSGIDDARMFALHGGPEGGKFLDAPDGETVSLTSQHIDQGVIDLLEVHGAGKWHIPSEAEYEAERKPESRYLDEIAGIPPSELTRPSGRSARRSRRRDGST